MTDDLHYTVRRFNWRWAGSCFMRLPGETRLARHDTREAAIQDRDEREREVRSRINPFECGPAFHYLTTLPEPVFCDWLRDESIEPPEPQSGSIPWAAWWTTARESLDEGQVSRIWNGLNRVQFHDVIERRDSQIAYAVMRIVWEYNDCFFEPGEEGGKTVVAFRDREKAMRRRDEMEIEERLRIGRQSGRVDYFEGWRWVESPWPSKEVSHYGEHEVDEPPLFEVVEIDLGSERDFP